MIKWLLCFWVACLLSLGCRAAAAAPIGALPGTVSLASELVHITVGRRQVRIDSRSEFVNRGAATTVRLGCSDRPNRSSGFQVTVDGADVSTAQTSGAHNIWHALSLSFRPDQHHVVRTIYILPLEARTAMEGRYYQLFYTLSGGATWAGSIERSEIEITFERPTLPARLILRPRQIVGEKYMANIPWSNLRPGTIIFQGPGIPQSRARTLRFVRTKWRPAPADDIALYWRE